MLLKQAEELELSAAAVLRLRWFEYFHQHGENVSLTCRYFGIARSTLVRWLDRFRPDDPSSLEEHSRRPLSVRRPETAPATVARIGALRRAHPLMGKEEISRLLAGEGIDASASTVGRVIAREGTKAFISPFAMQKRMERASNSCSFPTMLRLRNPNLPLSLSSSWEGYGSAGWAWRFRFFS